MNSKEIFLLCCMNKQKYLNDVEDEKNILKEIFNFLKIKPEYSLETLFFRRYYVQFYLIWDIEEEFDISYEYFKNLMIKPPKYTYKNDVELNCEVRFVLEGYYTQYIYFFNDENISFKYQKELMKNLELGYNLLYEKNIPRVFLYEAILLVKNIRKYVKKRLKKQ